MGSKLTKLLNKTWLGLKGYLKSLLTEHNGVKKTIEIQVVGNDGKVKIKEFSPFQLVIKKNADVDTDTDDKPSSSSSNKDYIVVNTAAK